MFGVKLTIDPGLNTKSALIAPKIGLKISK
jgi:hypothetical protein